MKFNIRKIIALIAISIISFSKAFAYDFEVDGIYYAFASLKDKTCKVVSGDVEYKGDIIIPAKVTYKNQELTVTYISGFEYCESLKSITIQEGPTKIDSNCFSECSSLISISLPETITEIGSNAFSWCSSLTTIDLPKGLKSLDGGAFYECSSLKTLEIPQGITKIASYAFYGCTALTNIYLPEGITSIVNCAFKNCKSLKFIEIPQSVTSIEDEAFSGCESLTHIDLPNTIKKLGEFAFNDCIALETINLGEGPDKIEIGTFNGCKSLKSLTIPGNINKIVIDKYNDSKRLREYTFGGCENLTEMVFEASVYFYRGTTQVSNVLFKMDDETPLNLKRFSLNSNFRDYTKTTIELPYLKEYIIGERVSRSPVIFKASEDLESITCYAAKPPVYVNSPTTDQYISVNVYVPDEYLYKYKSDVRWGNFWNLQGTSSVEEIGSDVDGIVEVGRFSLNGQKVDADYKGIVIVRFSDGSARKMIQR